ncbi:MAG: rhomboid family intramembrane serine protease [Rudaea sp.]|nr:rhomboid family intramembrane serine protease [Rudaea sp.]
MDIAAPTPEPSAAIVRRDRSRVGYALLGAFGLVAGIWLAWFGAWTLGWSMDDLGIRPHEPGGLVGVLTAPFAHASFEHLMSNTLPLGLLAALTLYAYPRATRYALPLIWLASGLGVWLWARPSVHVGISGIVVGLMLFLFLMGLLRRDRLGVAIALLVFFLYGGMLMSTLPRDPHVSFEYHLFGALAGIAAAIGLCRVDPLPPRKHYSWEEEDDEADPMSSVDDELEPPSPAEVPALWDGPNRRHEMPSAAGGDNIVAFPLLRPDGTTLH